MLHRSFTILTSALTFSNIYITADAVKAQCSMNNVQYWIDYSDQVLDYGNQMLEQMESQWEERINLCMQGDQSACRQIQLNNQSWQMQQPNMQSTYDMKSRSLQDTACMPYCY